MKLAERQEMQFKKDTEADILLEVVRKFYVRSFFIKFIIISNGSISPTFYRFLIDLASGTTIDWVYATQNVPLAYTFEFRDSRNGK